MPKKAPQPSNPTQESPILSSLPEKMREKVVHLESVDLFIAEVDPRTLHENPKNWRVHTRRQRSTYTAFKDKHGWLGFVVYNLKTNRLLDGHMRVDEAIKNNEPFVPVILKYVEEKAENEILATLDNIGFLAKRNTDALQSLLASNQKHLSELKGKNEERLLQLQKDLEEHNAKVREEGQSVVLPQAKTKVKLAPPPEPEPEPEETSTDFTPITEQEITSEEINPDVLFEGSTWLGIPKLLPHMLASPEDAPSRTYAREAYGTDGYYCISSGPFDPEEEIGTIGFYTEDWRFEAAYSDPAPYAEWLRDDLDPVAVITPDFSTYGDWPGAMRLWNLYRSRWCGRFWQELGMKIIPSLQGIGNPKQTIEYVFETLPDPCPVMSLQCRMTDIEGLIKYIKLLEEVRKPEVLVIYGGEEKQKYLHGYLPESIEYRYLMQFTEKRRILRKKNVETAF